MTKAVRVLIVEDEAMIAMMLAEVLRELGHEICATEATEAGAVAAAARHHPDLMIVDECLRQGSGISAVEEIIRFGFIPHVFVTGVPLAWPNTQSRRGCASKAVHPVRTGMGDQTRTGSKGHHPRWSAGLLITE